METRYTLPYMQALCQSPTRLEGMETKYLL